MQFQPAFDTDIKTKIPVAS